MYGAGQAGSALSVPSFPQDLPSPRISKVPRWLLGAGVSSEKYRKQEKGAPSFPCSQPLLEFEGGWPRQLACLPARWLAWPSDYQSTYLPSCLSCHSVSLPAWLFCGTLAGPSFVRALPYSILLQAHRVCCLSACQNVYLVVPRNYRVLRPSAICLVSSQHWTPHYKPFPSCKCCEKCDTLSASLCSAPRS